MGFITAVEKNERKKSSLFRVINLRAGAAHTETARRPGGLHTPESNGANTRCAPAGSGSTLPEPAATQGPCRRTVTSARLSGDSVTAARGRRGVYGFRGGTKPFPSARCSDFLSRGLNTFDVSFSLWP